MLIETRLNTNSLQNQQSIKVIIFGKMYFPNTFETLLEGDLLIILVVRCLYRLRYKYSWQWNFMLCVKTHDGKQGYVRTYL